MLSEILKFGITYIIPPIAILLIAWGGAQILLAGGSPGLLKAGIETIKWVAVGIAVILGAWIIVNTFFVFIGLANTDLGRGLLEWYRIDCGEFGMGNPPCLYFNGNEDGCRDNGCFYWEIDNTCHTQLPPPAPPEDERPHECFDVCSPERKELCVDETPSLRYKVCYPKADPNYPGETCLDWSNGINCGPDTWCQQVTPVDAECVLGCGCLGESKCASDGFQEKDLQQCINNFWQPSISCPSGQWCRGEDCFAKCVTGKPCPVEGWQKCNKTTPDPSDTLRCSFRLFWEGAGEPCSGNTECVDGPGGSINCL